MKSEIKKWNLELLRWVARQHQRGCKILAINQKAQIYEKLDYAFLTHLDRYIPTASLPIYTQVLANQIKNLIEEGRLEEAEEVILEMKILNKRPMQSPSGKSTTVKSISSTMKLEAAKILAEEGDPESGVFGGATTTGDTTNGLKKLIKVREINYRTALASLRKRKPQLNNLAIG